MSSPDRHILSKSTFIKGCQCEKALYLNRYQPQLKAQITDQQQAVFDRGTDIGLLAQQLFPGGIDASPENHFEYAQSVVLTQELIATGTEVIYEASFQHEGVLAALDILVKRDGKWKAYEVKSNLDVYENHIMDAALQFHVVTQSGIPLEDISIVHLNREYVRQGTLEISKLFVAESILTDVLDKQDFISKQIPFLKEVLAQPEVPARQIGPHCHSPYPCDFVSHCWKHIPSPSIFDISNLKDKQAFEMYNSGIIRFEDVANDTSLSDKQRIQVDCHLAKKEHIDQDALKGFIEGLSYPMYFLDFETFNPAVPLYDGTRPYQQVPFQYSLHYKKSSDSELRHTDFLAPVGPDPRSEFLERLLHMTRLPGTLVTYNQTFEQGILRKLSEQFPTHTVAILERISRLRDLMTPFQKYLFYSHKMSGSYSIKAVLPALIPDLSYDHLPISDGTTASNAFAHMTLHPEENTTELRKQMKEYCKMDTLAMVRILEKLEQLTG